MHHIKPANQALPMGPRLIAENHTKRTQPALRSPSSSPTSCLQHSGLCFSAQSLGVAPPPGETAIPHPSQKFRAPQITSLLTLTLPMREAQNSTPEPPSTSPSLSLHSAPSLPRAPPILVFLLLAYPPQAKPSLWEARKASGQCWAQVYVGLQ